MTLILKLSIILFAFCEFMLLSFYNDHYGSLKSPLLLLICSLLIGIIGIVFSQKKYSISIQTTTRKSNYLSAIILFAIGITGSILVANLLNPIFESHPIDLLDVSESDIIPQIGIMVDRLFQSQYPYSPITEWGYTLNPTYLPLQWMPFSLAKLFGFDYRWVPVIILNFALLIYLYNVYKYQSNIILQVLLAILPYSIWYLVIYDEPKVFAYTIETLIVAYYLILGMSLFSKKPWFIAIGITLCLLSRFSLILWLPLFAFIYLMDDYRQLFRIALYVVAAILVIYVFPFLLKDPEIFIQGMEHHTRAAVGEWQPYWQNPSDKPYHLFRGVGMAAFFYEWVEGDVAQRIRVLQMWHLGSIIISVFLLSLYFLWRKTKIYIPLFLLSGLKIYFCFFYYFIQIPYIYLMIVPLFTTILLLFFVLSLQKSTKQHIK